MTLEDVDMAELPASLCSVLDKEYMRWEVYAPTTIEADIPFKDHWWKFVYWMPRIKKEFYILALSQTEKAVWDKARGLGMNEEFFKTNYRDFLKRLQWMRKNNNYNHLGEV